MGLAIVRLSGRLGLVGRWGRGLSGQEQDGQERPECGDAAGDEGADGEAAQEGLVEACCSAWPRAGWPRAVSWPAAA
jgi:hypothetical protein